jgi:hypothetical protein
MGTRVRLAAVALFAVSMAAGCGSAAAVHHPPPSPPRHSPAAPVPNPTGSGTTILTGACGLFWANYYTTPPTRQGARALGHELASLTSVALRQKGVPLNLPNDIGDAGLALVRASYTQPGSAFRQQVRQVDGSSLRTVMDDCTR